jgi:nitrogen fixation protein NifU and related proteins
MADLRAYDDLIMDHIKNARNYRALADATHHANGTNPLCGDELAVFLRLEGDRIMDAAFQCTCCGISMASASVMTESARGQGAVEVRALVASVVAALTARADPASRKADPAQYALLKTVQQFPGRTRCAVLPWVTLEAALDNRQEPVSLS